MVDWDSNADGSSSHPDCPLCGRQTELRTVRHVEKHVCHRCRKMWSVTMDNSTKHGLKKLREDQVPAPSENIGTRIQLAMQAAGLCEIDSGEGKDRFWATGERKRAKHVTSAVVRRAIKNLFAHSSIKPVAIQVTRRNNTIHVIVMKPTIQAEAAHITSNILNLLEGRGLHRDAAFTALATRITHARKMARGGFGDDAPLVAAQIELRQYLSGKQIDIHSDPEVIELLENSRSKHIISTYGGWRRLAMHNGATRFEGDKDIANAFNAKGRAVGEWGGDVGWVTMISKSVADWLRSPKIGEGRSDAPFRVGDRVVRDGGDEGTVKRMIKNGDEAMDWICEVRFDNGSYDTVGQHYLTKAEPADQTRLCGTHGWQGNRAWHHDFTTNRKVWSPKLGEGDGRQGFDVPYDHGSEEVDFQCFKCKKPFHAPWNWDPAQYPSCPHCRSGDVGEVHPVASVGPEQRHRRPVAEGGDLHEGRFSYNVGDVVKGPFGNAEILRIDPPTMKNFNGAIHCRQLDEFNEEIKPGFEFESNTFQFHGHADTGHAKRLSQHTGGTWPANESLADRILKGSLRECEELIDELEARGCGEYRDAGLGVLQKVQGDGAQRITYDPKTGQFTSNIWGREADVWMDESEDKMLLADLLKQTGHYSQPYPGGGIQVFHQPGTTGGDRRYWHLKDAHVVGTLSGPSIHVMPHPLRENCVRTPITATTSNLGRYIASCCIAKVKKLKPGKKSTVKGIDDCKLKVTNLQKKGATGAATYRVEPV